MKICAHFGYTGRTAGATALFWPATLAFQANKARLSARIISAENSPKPDDDGLIPGFIYVLPYLATQFVIGGTRRWRICLSWFSHRTGASERSNQRRRRQNEFTWKCFIYIIVVDALTCV